MMPLATSLFLLRTQILAAMELFTQWANTPQLAHAFGPHDLAQTLTQTVGAWQ